MGPTAYAFDPGTFDYKGEVAAQPCKVEVGRFYAPRFSTFVKPPGFVEGKRLVFNFARDNWEYADLEAPVEPMAPVQNVKGELVSPSFNAIMDRVRVAEKNIAVVVENRIRSDMLALSKSIHEHGAQFVRLENLAKGNVATSQAETHALRLRLDSYEEEFKRIDRIHDDLVRDIDELRSKLSAIESHQADKQREEITAKHWKDLAKGFAGLMLLGLLFGGACEMRKAFGGENVICSIIDGHAVGDLASEET